MTMIDRVAPGLENRSPEAEIELTREMAKKFRSFRPGQVVKVTIEARIHSLNFRKPQDPDLTGYEGQTCLKIRSLKADLAAQNDVAELLDDDE